MRSHPTLAVVREALRWQAERDAEDWVRHRREASLAEAFGKGPLADYGAIDRGHMARWNDAIDPAVGAGCASCGASPAGAGSRLARSFARRHLHACMRMQGGEELPPPAAAPQQIRRGPPPESGLLGIDHHIIPHQFALGVDLPIVLHAILILDLIVYSLGTSKWCSRPPIS